MPCKGPGADGKQCRIAGDTQDLQHKCISCGERMHAICGYPVLDDDGNEEEGSGAHRRCGDCAGGAAGNDVLFRATKQAEPGSQPVRDANAGEKRSRRSGNDFFWQILPFEILDRPVLQVLQR